MRLREDIPERDICPRNDLVQRKHGGPLSHHFWQRYGCPPSCKISPHRADSELPRLGPLHSRTRLGCSSPWTVELNGRPIWPLAAKRRCETGPDLKQPFKAACKLNGLTTRRRHEPVRRSGEKRPSENEKCPRGAFRTLGTSGNPSIPGPFLGGQEPRRAIQKGKLVEGTRLDSNILQSRRAIGRLPIGNICWLIEVGPPHCT